VQEDDSVRIVPQPLWEQNPPLPAEEVKVSEGGLAFVAGETGTFIEDCNGSLPETGKLLLDDLNQEPFQLFLSRS
jgi:hypothetical protein